jgi:MYXO-CTERM domain-containing protein
MTPPGKPLQVTLPASFLSVNPLAANSLATSAQMVANGEDSFYSFNINAAGNVYVYGQLMGNCFAHINGYISCGGSPEFFDNQGLPDSRFGGTHVFAPFWDDLIPVPGESSLLTEQQAGQFFAIEWTNFALYHDPTARLTFRVVFQVQASPVFQGSVLFQYVSMQGAAGGGADGSSATIGIQNANGYGANQYSLNAVGAVIATVMAPGPTPSPSPSPAPSTAVQAVFFDFDKDGDRLADGLEASFNADPALHDTDNDGQDDGVEVANGANPSASPAPVTLDATDIDGDTLSGAEEAFYGTDPVKKDSDGDTTFMPDGVTPKTSLNDNEELYGLNGHPITNPTQIDTDHDGFLDGAEIDAGTDPLNPNSHPAVSVVNLAISTVVKYRPSAAVDALGRVHIVAPSRNPSPTGLYYYMVNADGTVRIPETFFKTPVSTTSTTARNSAVAVFQGKVYAVYTLTENGPGQLMFLRIDPSKAPQDGSGIIAPSILDTGTSLTLPAGVRIPKKEVMAVGASGIHIVMCGSSRTGESSKNGWFYALYDLNGNLVSSTRLTTGGPSSGGHNGGGLDRKTRAAITLDSTGVAHIFIKNRGGEDHRRSAPSFDYYAQAKNGVVSGPYSFGQVNESDVGIAISGNLVYLSGTGGGAGQSNLANSVNLGVLDPTNFAVVTHDPDQWGITATIDPASMPLPFTSVYTHNDRTKGGGLVVLPSGATAIAFKTHNNNDVCIGVFAPTGASLGTPFCTNVGWNPRPKSNPEPMLLPQNRLGFVFNNNNSDSGVRFVALSLDTFNTTSVPMLPPVTNTPPTFTSMPSVTGTSGVPYSYAATATDAQTAAANLTWSIIKGPMGFTISSTGMVTWTPTVGDIGPNTVTIQVCDDGTPKRCTQQSYTLTVGAPQPPVITSVPGTSAIAGKLYTYQVVAVGDAPITGYSVVAPAPAPGNMAISASGALTWTPTDADVGSVSIQLKATDLVMQSATQSYTLTVLPAPLPIVDAGAKAPPIFTSIPSTVAVAGTHYTYQAVAIDPGNSAATFTYLLTSKASGDMVADPTGLLTWKPTGAEQGTVVVTIQATEGNGATATQTFSVTVVTPAAQSSGCGCVVGGANDRPPALVWLLLLGCALLISRRRNA